MASRVTDELLNHDYDGIREYDNPLPRWWVYLLYGTIVFALVYVPYYHFGPGTLPQEDFEADMQAWYELHPPIQLPDAAEMEKMIADDPSMLTRGKEVFGVRCVSCHAADGGGLVGPNLTDDFSIHGQGLDRMVRVVYEGVPAKGMLAWKSQLPPEDIFAVAAFAHSLRGTTPAKPRDPQGDPIEEPVASAN